MLKRDVELLFLGVAGDSMTSMRSRSAGGRVEQLAVVMNRTSGEVEGDVEIVVAEGVVLLGVENLSSAEAGSPRKSAPSLSISSRMKTGLLTRRGAGPG